MMDSPDTGTDTVPSERLVVVMVGEIVSVVGQLLVAPPLLPKMVAVVASEVRADTAEKEAALKSITAADVATVRVMDGYPMGAAVARHESPQALLPTMVPSVARVTCTNFVALQQVRAGWDQL